MGQAFHIFKKDVRHLWLEISIAVAAVVGFTFTVARQAQSLNDPLTQGIAPALLTTLLPLAWWGLIARLIYTEPLAGDQPFWVTRPYARKSLLTAKALFIVVFVNLPKLIGDAVILRSYEFRFWPELGGLVWTQVLLIALFILPVVALCAVTTGFAQAIIAIFVLVLTVAGWNMVASELGAGLHWLALEWMRSACIGGVVALAALAIVVRQYRHRDTLRSRVIAGGAVLLVFLVLAFLPWTAAFALQSWIGSQSADVSAMHVGFDPAMHWAGRAFVSGDNVDLEIPLRITGVPAAMQLKPEGITASIEGPGGDLWRTGRHPRSHVRSTGDITSFNASLTSRFYQKVRDQPVRIRGSVYLTLYGNPRRAVLPIRDRAVFLPTPGVGLCSATRTARGILLDCRSAFRSWPDLVTFDVIGPHPFVPGALPISFRTLSSSRPVSYSPFPADPNLTPVTESMQNADISSPASDQVRVVGAVALEPVAHVRKDFEITGLRLAEYEVKR